MQTEQETNCACVGNESTCSQAKYSTPLKGGLGFQTYARIAIPKFVSPTYSLHCSSFFG